MTRFIVVLGTTSHSGKSTIVAALCRILRNRGLKVAPFKSQNMSLNSWVTYDGKEMGIAQAVQAWAAGVEPEEVMNPILLKPKGDRTSQVIVFGVPVADMSAEEYYRGIEGMKSVVDRAIEELSGEAEINLYDRDIANIYVARKLAAPIILVGDIERGGVFASLYGTVALLPADIRPLVCGLVINKFRGDPAILEPGLAMLEELTGVPVLGVMPYLDLALPSEDSVSLGDKGGGGFQGAKREEAGGSEAVDIAVIRLARISNFTDFEPLEREGNLRYVTPGQPLGRPDAVIIPGTKNTVADLLELRRRGTDREILALRDEGVPVLGICGGYQILGREIVDQGIEDGDSVVAGLGLLNSETRFDRYEKRTVQAEKTVTGDGPILGPIKGEKVSGYEIHMGVTTSQDPPAFGDDGGVGGDGLVIGTYLHGIFQNRNFRDAFLDHLYRRKNLPRRSAPVGDGYDELAKAAEIHLDMKRIWDMMEI
ncbi:cobyric acid synthase [Candidatus Methanocrinis natronophilus]|uniref:Probable cobyric acid synthase n=1 Tax=Candidatus Methanocrinis natronophilus TaxID=3033396 RepID=A0ABT5X7D2_9EURY|nr:cobyric acid synthase [Candidatus Methanocrinis natronophilus]MDF0590609.1 cobyric acid synthase [Candidatus Methanocrinis natronophilus]